VILTINSHFPIHQQRAGGHHADAGGADADLLGVAGFQQQRIAKMM